MQKEEINNQTECLECKLPAQERLNYFTGQFLAERDFRDEQNYHIGKHRNHNRYLHGWGTVCGLRVVQHPQPECRDRFVIIEQGLALDCCGREIVVREKVYVDLAKELAPTNGDSENQGKNLLISLCYKECKTEYVPALYSECGCDENRCEANRIHEGFEVRIKRIDQLPEEPHFEPIGVRLNWTTTINLDKASRLALDSGGKRLYVLNSADQGQIIVYDAEHHCLLRSINIEGHGVDLAISPNRDFLYVLRYVVGTPSDSGDYFLRVIDVQNLDNPNTLNDLQLSSSPLTNPPRVTVAEADGRVYTLDPNSTPKKKVVIWKTEINSAEVDPATSLYAEVETGGDPRDIAVSPDGKWLFIAEGPDAEDANKRIKAAKVETLTSLPADQVIHKISLTEKPELLGISGDSLRLFVVTAAKKVHAFRIQESPSSFPEIGTGVEVGPDEPVAIAVSPSGKWVYVLVKDKTGKGWIKIVNGEKFETDPEHAVSDPVAVVSGPQDILLDREGRRLYAAGEGDVDQHCGGVSVLDVNQEHCGEIRWHALEGCPKCPDDICVPLAAIRDYTKEMVITDREIDNRIRPMVTSTETLRQMILCALETGTGKQGPEGPQGPAGPSGVDSATASATGLATGTPPTASVTYNSANRKLDFQFGIPKGDPGLKGDPGPSGVDSANASATGLNPWQPPTVAVTYDSVQKNLNFTFGIPKGDTGDPGEGLEQGLTRIVALSWEHNSGNNPLMPIVRRYASREQEIACGIIIGFSGKVLPPTTADSFHVFQVLVWRSNPDQPWSLCWCPVYGQIIAVNFVGINNRITKAIIPQSPGPATGWAFVPLKQTANFLVDKNLILVRLHGDFVLDENKKAIDAEFVRASLPTGDRPSGSNYGIQGGVFESWLSIGEKALIPARGVINVNIASAEELVTIGIPDRAVHAIIARRDSAPIRNIEELSTIRGVSARLLASISDRITID